MSAPVELVPLVDWAPLQPPEAAQLVEYAAPQLSVDDYPAIIVDGLASRITRG
jgi:hypothetical protein